ncbi:hypothetical protein [uncultured Chitinophaga sp.]|uniref:hypothetical protein n=1 Tax=uncultured Chitinophaga sp. TaxID=339340 RepID=UPI0025E23634|nr:hypothetical protein [uncultured Chitinophaga sp.]
MLHLSGIGSLAIGNNIHDQEHVQLVAEQPMAVTPGKGLTGGAMYRYVGDIDELNNNVNIRSRIEAVLITTSTDGCIGLLMLVLPTVDADTLITELRILFGEEEVMSPLNGNMVFVWKRPNGLMKTMLLLPEEEAEYCHLIYLD